MKRLSLGALHISKRLLAFLGDGLLAIVSVGIMGFACYWMLLSPSSQPFGLAKLTAPVPSIDSTTAALSESGGISENDILVTERDEGDGKIEKLSPRLINNILRDRAGRIDDAFEVPDDLRKRVEFWFKLYSMYTISNAVVHDITHPWIVYEVINLNSIYSKYRSRSKRNGAKSQMIRSARYQYINILKKLAKRNHYHGLSKSEKRVYKLFKGIKGNKRQIFTKAARKVRVQLGQKDSVIYAIKKSGRYLKTMEKIFKKNKLPVELTRIPFLESSFNLEAYSKDGASGIWQFMSKTGRSFLKISHARGIDERNDPLKATKAATRLLRQNYRILKSWPLAVTAYNHGPGGILRGIRKTGSRNLNDIIERYSHSYFGFASKNFYSEFLAMLHVERYQDKIFGYIKKDRRLVHDDIEVKYPMRVGFIMDLCKISKKDIKLYNPDLRKKTLDSRTYLPDGYYLKVPKGKKKALLKFYKEVEETNRILDELLGKEG